MRGGANAVREGCYPEKPEEVTAVHEQLEKLLADPLFSLSRRYPIMLRRIVEDTLSGRTQNLKERVLGMELFDRAADYDTNSDAIVRVTAAEIRKRIAQYYHNEKHASEIRIELPVGSYVAEFKPALIAKEPPAAEPASPEPEFRKSASEGPFKNNHGISRRAMQWGLVSGFVLVLIVCIVIWLPRKSDFQLFWQPFVTSAHPPLICVGQLRHQPAEKEVPEGSLAHALLSQKPVSISDAIVISNFAAFLATHGLRPRIQVSSMTSYTDLRNSPVLLVGGIDNNWTMHFLSGLHFRMAFDPVSSTARIYNAEGSLKESWIVDFAAQAERETEDYAIVARFADPTTENTVMISAGLGEDGTSAAADFLTHPQYLSTLNDGKTNGWEQKNVEAVIKTQIIDGKPGPPILVARYFW